MKRPRTTPTGTVAPEHMRQSGWRSTLDRRRMLARERRVKAPMHPLRLTPMTPPLPAHDEPTRPVLSAARRLRSPSAGLLGQGVRFGLAGATVALVYLATTLLLADLVG